MSGEAVGWAFRKVQMDDATAKFVLVAICNYANEEDRAWPSHAAIARLTGLSKRTIQNSIQKLEDWGIIRRDRRDRENGSETSAMVVIDLNTSWIVKGGIATAAIGVVQQLPQGVATDSTLETKDKPQGKAPGRGKGDAPYSEEFEIEVWQPFPRKTGTSKKKAWDHWRMLTDQQQQQIKKTIPLYAAQMKREGRTEDKIKWLAHFISERIYETMGSASSSAPAAPGVQHDWYKTATPEQWAKVLERWRETDRWSTAWGPDPGQSGCRVPTEMLAAHNLKYRAHLFREADLQRFREIVGKHAVDSHEQA